MARRARRRLATEGPERAQFLLERVVEARPLTGAAAAPAGTTPYVNTIPPQRGAAAPGRPRARAAHALAHALERDGDGRAREQGVVGARRPHRELRLGRDALRRRLQPLLARADRPSTAATSSSSRATRRPASTRARSSKAASPRSSCDNFRQEVDGNGLSSYPHPWLMPDFWQFPTVSMGLGPLMAIYQARFMQYLHDRGLADTERPQGLGVHAATARWTSPSRSARSRSPAREKLDNLIFVVNCNLQRLDGPVRGNGKIIQELESDFRGAGWNVIKVIWGSRWDPLLARDNDGHPAAARWRRRVDGEYQTFKSRDGAYVREHFFGKYPELRAMVADMTDDEIWAPEPRRPRPAQGLRRLRRGGRAQGPADRDPRQDDQGLRHGRGGRGPEHHAPAEEDGRRGAAARSATASSIPITDDELDERAVLQAAPTTRRRCEYLRERREALGGYLPQRAAQGASRSPVPRARARSSALLEGTGEREISTTMAFVRILSTLLRDKTLGTRVVPIVADESRTFGMEGMFRQLGIYSPGRPALRAARTPTS